MDGSQVVPGIPVVRLLLRTAAERLRRASEVALLQCAVAQGEPALRMQRVHTQRQLPVLRRLWLLQAASQGTALKRSLLEACRAPMPLHCLIARWLGQRSALWVQYISAPADAVMPAGGSHSCRATFWRQTVQRALCAREFQPPKCSRNPPNTSAGKAAIAWHPGQNCSAGH